MKYGMLVVVLVMLSSCMSGKPGFDVDAQVHRSSLDTGKGIQIQVFPIDKSEAKAQQ